jgi:hypothetical protein
MSHVGPQPLACPLLLYCLERLTAGGQSGAVGGGGGISYAYIPATGNLTVTIGTGCWYRICRCAAGAVAIALCIPSAQAFWAISQTALHGEIASTPRGPVSLAASPAGTREMLARIAAAPAEERFFFYPHIALLSFLTARPQVSKYELFVPYYTAASQYQEACLSAMRLASWVIINRGSPNVWKRTYPMMRKEQPVETVVFEQALLAGFELATRYGDFEVRRRSKGVDEAICLQVY